MAKKNKFGSKGWTPERIDSLAGKTFVITGANSGTGYEASKILLSKGAKVDTVITDEQNKGMTALLFAKKNGYSKVIELLEEAQKKQS